MKINEELIYSIIGFIFMITFLLIFSITNNWRLGVLMFMFGLFSSGIFVVNLFSYLEKRWNKKKFVKGEKKE